MGAAQNPTEQLKGIDSRGTAALRQAIAIGAPVPTTGEQAKELNTAPTLAAENARLRAALEKVETLVADGHAESHEHEPCWSAIVDDVLIVASAALRGGAK
jgi:hypothetical protein